MNKYIFSFILLMLSLFLISCADQNGGFEKIEYASFKTGKSKNGLEDSMRIQLYAAIDKNGLTKVLNNDNYHDTLKFYSHQLNKEQFYKVSLIFNSSKNLNNYFAVKQLGKDEFYAGSYDVFFVNYQNGRKDSLCFIEPFMQNEFNSIYKMLNDDVFYGDEVTPIPSFKISESFRESALINYKQCTFLPERKTLPSFKLEDQ